MQRHGNQQLRRRRRALARGGGQQHAEHARVFEAAVVLELADHFVHGVFEAQRHQQSGRGRVLQGRSAWQKEQRSRSAEAPRNPHRQQRGGNSVAARARESALGPVNRTRLSWLTMLSRVPNMPAVLLAGHTVASRKSDANQ